MNTRFTLALSACLLAVASSPCLALREINPLSPTEARAMGVELRMTPAGPNAAWLDLDFQTKGRLKDYSPEHSSSRVELEIRDGAKSLLSYAALQEHHPKPGQVRVRFMANLEYLDKLVLTIVVGDGLLPGGAYELRVKEFLDPATTR